MKTLPYTKQQFCKAYLKYVDELTEECDWISSFTAEEICNMSHRIMDGKSYTVRRELLPFTSSKLYKLYTSEVEKLNISTEQWRKEYNAEKIAGMIYDIMLKDIE